MSLKINGKPFLHCLIGAGNRKRLTRFLNLFTRNQESYQKLKELLEAQDTEGNTARDLADALQLHTAVDLLDRYHFLADMYEEKENTLSLINVDDLEELDEEEDENLELLYQSPRGFTVYTPGRGERRASVLQAPVDQEEQIQLQIEDEIQRQLQSLNSNLITEIHYP